ncbi:hypothetical protein LSAT2_015443 [Lamellibrachia satsuma]|nr:hypothetical protein LSAT2_015443 [Lamellibrachia satsuma]
MKLLEIILDVRIRKKVEQELGEEQQGFRKGRRMTDGMFALRQMVQKRLEMQGRMAVGFVDLEKAYDTVPREMVMATMRWMGVPEAEATMVEAMYERTKGRVVVGSGLSGRLLVNIGLRQGSALSPLLFIMVMEIISRKINTKDILRKMMYADDLAIIAESKQDLQEVLEEWKGVFEKHGLRMSLEKTEVMWVGHQREELNIRLDSKEMKQVDGFVYLGGMVTEYGHSEAEVRCRTQAGANAWRKANDNNNYNNDNNDDNDDDNTQADDSNTQAGNNSTQASNDIQTDNNNNHDNTQAGNNNTQADNRNNTQADNNMEPDNNTIERTKNKTEDCPLHLVNCVSSCEGKANDQYQSCLSCHSYVSCYDGMMDDSKQCQQGLIWDDINKWCDLTSTTCIPCTEDGVATPSTSTTSTTTAPWTSTTESSVTSTKGIGLELSRVSGRGPVVLPRTVFVISAVIFHACVI